VSEVRVWEATPTRQLHSASQLTSDQTIAIETAVEWYLGGDKPYFQIRRLAGTGKTSIIRYIVDELGLGHSNPVLYGAYTGKTTRVLTSNAQTLLEMSRWLYTAITRASKGLVIAG
jgi:hypothetical protein